MIDTINQWTPQLLTDNLKRLMSGTEYAFQKLKMSKLLWGKKVPVDETSKVMSTHGNNGHEMNS